MKKYIGVSVSINETGAPNINVEVLDGPLDLMNVSCGGYIEDGDLDDLATPAEMMVLRLLGYYDDELTETLAAAFHDILTPKPVASVSINGVPFG